MFIFQYQIQIIFISKQSPIFKIKDIKIISFNIHFNLDINQKYKIHY